MIDTIDLHSSQEATYQKIDGSLNVSKHLGSISWMENFTFFIEFYNQTGTRHSTRINNQAHFHFREMQILGNKNDILHSHNRILPKNDQLCPACLSIDISTIYQMPTYISLLLKIENKWFIFHSHCTLFNLNNSFLQQPKLWWISDP